MRTLATAMLTALAGVGAWVVGRALGARLAGGDEPSPRPDPLPKKALDIEDAVEVGCSSRSKA